jgi:ABC-type transport system involved in cytochrome bd biosynthesis fused ATPase/permease subunit|nr:MAG TPA: hypothetical protein [Caudoviricetes sp.]
MKEFNKVLLDVEKDMRDFHVKEVSKRIDNLKKSKDEESERISDSLKKFIKNNADWENYNSEYWYKLGYLEAEEDTNKKRGTKARIAILAGITIGIIAGIIKNK